MKTHFLLLLAMAGFYTLSAQQPTWQGKFEQMDQEFSTPNAYRNADGAPGPSYWQQRADYDLDIQLNDATQEVTGRGTITYHNQSPQTLTYLWLQLDQNKRASHSDEQLARSFQLQDTIPSKSVVYNLNFVTTEESISIDEVTDKKGNDLSYVINKTMMRIDLPKALEPGKSVDIKMKWHYNLNNRMEDFGRSGYEYFPEDGNYVYTIAQFYPRLAVYDDVEGWQNKQFLGSGEFALSFGDFKVRMTVPDDHLLVATGELQNAKQVLSKTHYDKFQEAKKSFEKPVIIANEEEAIKRESSNSGTYQTWEYEAKNVRDFAFACSRKFIWDAQAVRIGDNDVLAMSLYPKEGNPLWELESTKAVINTLKTYSKYSVDYPYPVATSIHAASIGMEYPMICFNFGRPNSDGSYNDAVKYNMIGVIIHEVGHNFFPMIVNTDERQYGWMDEGLNSFLEYLTEQENYENFPSSRGPAGTIVNYMKGNTNFIRPIMTNPEQVVQLGNNAYGKPAAALNILREVVLGRELFDKAFKTFSERWAFKHPKPEDFFRTMEDASAVDLDWFWRGWFYTTDHVDLALDTVIWYRMDATNEVAYQKSGPGPNISEESEPILERPANFAVVPSPDFHYGEFKERQDEVELRQKMENLNYYQVSVSNKGGLVMPVILYFEFEDKTYQRIQLPAEVWRYNENRINKVFYFPKKVTSVAIDPYQKTADTDQSNNSMPRAQPLSRFEQFKKSMN